MSEGVPKEEDDEQIEAEYVRETKNSKGLAELGSFLCWSFSHNQARRHHCDHHVSSTKSRSRRVLLKVWHLKVPARKEGIPLQTTTRGKNSEVTPHIIASEEMNVQCPGEDP